MFFSSLLESCGELANLRLDRITSEDLGKFAATRQATGMQVSTVNRELATVRRMFNLASDWGKVITRLPRVRMNPGENQRTRVLAAEEEHSYLKATSVPLAGFSRPMRRRSRGFVRSSGVSSRSNPTRFYYGTWPRS